MIKNRKEVTLSEIMDFKNGLNFTKSDNGEKIKIVGVSDFKDLTELNSTDNLDVVSISSKIKNDELLKDGDLLFVRSNGNKELIGRCLYFPTVTERLSFSGFTIRGRVKDKNVLPAYVAQLARTSLIKKEINKNGGGTNISNLSQQILNAIVIKLPEYVEQIKIVEILSTWDNAIQTTEKLLENSRQQKKALMQRLLKGNNWLQADLAELAVISKGSQLNKNTLSDNGQYAVINGGIEPSGYTDKFNTESNTITISEGGNSCGYIGFQKEKFWCGGHCYALSNLRINCLFLYQLLKYNEENIMRLRVGSGLPNIQKKALESFSLSYPQDISEQQKIAEILSTADQEIETLQRKLECLKLEKGALMQRLL
ncbi:restriction endonuclease subunit S [[Pasteurella] aerogenes]